MPIASRIFDTFVHGGFGDVSRCNFSDVFYAVCGTQSYSHLTVSAILGKILFASARADSIRE